MRFEIYESRRLGVGPKRWRWRLKAGNNRIVAVSSEGYNRREDCRASIALVKQSERAATVWLPPRN